MNCIKHRVRSDPADTLAIEAKPVAFPDLLPEIRHLYGAMAKRKGLEFAIDIEADVPPAIVTDQRCLQRLLCSLLASAFEFTRAGSVTLRIRRVGGEVREATVIAFDIVYTGTAPVQLHNIVDFFELVPAGRQCGHDAGGLSSAGRISALLGGYLASTTTHGGMATFSVCLPLVARPGRSSYP
jgi:hypothetical protein